MYVCTRGRKRPRCGRQHAMHFGGFGRTGDEGGGSAADVGGGRPFRIVGVGFSSFVMNLVGVNGLGVPVGEEASISYACNTAEVAKEVQSLQW